MSFLVGFFAAFRVFFCSRAGTALEVLALRQQLAVPKRERPRAVLDHALVRTLDLAGDRAHGILQVYYSFFDPAFVASNLLILKATTVHAP